ncbi:MAG: class I SAM-dependent rRNA methyltransferase, partial [Clostridia bacterium]|nr:class I SAM-dependent rRNA methyltransferase [Clostridia bacterium]
VDRYGDVLSVQFLTLGTDMRKQMIVDVLNEIYSPVSIVERSDVAVRKKEGLPETKGVIFGENKTETVIEENGIKMHVDLLNGQKTGYFLDQKFNRFSIRKYVRNKTVLDCFCNVGGFSMNAAIAGAEKVYALDISPVAIKEVEKNAELNGFTVITPILCDVFDKLRVFKTEKKRFGAIVLDPPAFCKDKGQVNSALKGYKDINVLAMKLLEPDGVLFSSSCSHFISTEQFKKMLVESAKESGKIFQITEIRSQGNDHPMLLCNDESSYLKFFILKAVNAKA